MIPRELYTLGAVKFDVNQLADRLVAAKAIKQKAEQEAFEKYFTEGQKLTPTGVRAQDLPGFEQRRRNWQTFTIQNKDKIAKDPYIRLQANELFNEAVNYVQRSKQATDKLNPVRDMTIDPTKRKSLNSERVMVDIALHERPLDDPNRKDIDINQAWYKPSVYDFDKDFNAVAQGQQKAFLRKIPNTFDPQLGTIQTEEGYLPNSVKQIATDYRRVVEADPEKLDYWERQANEMDPARITRLNQVFKRIFPNIQADADNPIVLAMATAAEKAESRKDVVPKTDVRYASGLIASRGGGGGESGESFIDYWAEINAKPEMIIGNPADSKRQVRGVPLNSLTATPQKRIIDIANSITGEKFEQRDLILQTMPDGSKHILQVLYEGKGKDAIYPTGVKDIVAVNPEDINLKPQIDVKSKRKAVEEAKKSKGTYNIGGKSFTRQQIEQGAKAYGMTVDEYLASFENE